MKTIILEKPGEFRAADTAVPSGCAGGLGDGAHSSRGRCAGRIGTRFMGISRFLLIRDLGHELACVIERVNDPASDLKPGDKCSIEPYFNCGKCMACRRGKSNCCADLKTLGVHIDGGCASGLLCR